MTRMSKRLDGFSLVEVTLALGVAGICLLAIIGLLPNGLRANQSAFSQTAAASILSNVVADMRSTPSNSLTSAQYGISFSGGADLYFDSEGRSSVTLQNNSRYRVVIRIPTTTTAATCADIKVSWPAVIDPTTNAIPAGLVETVAAFNR